MKLHNPKRQRGISGHAGEKRKSDPSLTFRVVMVEQQNHVDVAETLHQETHRASVPSGKPAQTGESGADVGSVTVVLTIVIVGACGAIHSFRTV